MLTILFKKLRPQLLIVVHNAPQRSAFNPVERSMAFLNQPLGGVTLPIFSEGVHIINQQVPPTLVELEKKNVQKAMNILERLWENVRINQQQVAIQVIPPGTQEFDPLVRNIMQYKKSPLSLPESGNIFSVC